MDASSIEQTIRSRICDSKFEEVHLLNLSEVSERPSEAFCVAQKLLKSYKENYRKRRNDVSYFITSHKIQQLGSSLEHLDKRLQEHMCMLRQNENSLTSTNAVLEYDAAKNKTDKLVEILRAKITWKNSYEEIQFLDHCDQNIKYQKLVALQKSFDVLHKYLPVNSEKERNFEKMKDEFLSWFSSATVIAIDTNDEKQLETIREKYLMLNRITVFEQIFGIYAKNKIKCFMEEEGRSRSIWDVLQEVFAIWKRCQRLAHSFIGSNGSAIIANNLWDGVLAKWDVIANVILELTCSSESPFSAAREIGKTCADYLAYAEAEGDDEIVSVSRRVCQKIFASLSDDYGKHVSSVLLCTINKITAPERSSRHRHNWLLPYVDEIHSCMREMVNEACATFGAGFCTHIVPSFEHGVKELNSLIFNKDVLSINGLYSGRDGKSKRSVQENTEDKISAICVTGALLNLVDKTNDYILECFDECCGENDDVKPQLISNKSLFQHLNKKVVAQKIEAIANSITHPMDDEMMKLKLKSASAATTSSSSSADTAADPSSALQMALPSFSIPPHNYITNVGHGLLSAMNTISMYGVNKNFVSAIASVAGKNFNEEEEADLWMLNEVGTHVMDAFCQNIGNVSHLDQQLARQFHTDVVFLTEALVDLRLQPTPRLEDCASKLKKAITA